MPGLPKRRRPGPHRNCCNVGVMVGVAPGTVTLSPLMCKSWGCPRCRPLLVARWSATLAQARKKVGFVPHQFVTVTMRPDVLERGCKCAFHRGEAKRVPPDCRLLDWRWQQEQLRRRWQRMVKLARRVAPCSYWRVYEFHRGLSDRRRPGLRNWRLHIHALISSGIRDGGIKEQYRSSDDDWAMLADRCGLGRTKAYSVDVHEMNAYVFKYAGKQKRKCYEWKVRMTGCSRDIRHEKPEPSLALWRPTFAAHDMAYAPESVRGGLLDSLETVAEAVGGSRVEGMGYTWADQSGALAAAFCGVSSGHGVVRADRRYFARLGSAAAASCVGSGSVDLGLDPDIARRPRLWRGCLESGAEVGSAFDNAELATEKEIVCGV